MHQAAARVRVRPHSKRLNHKRKVSPRISRQAGEPRYSSELAITGILILLTVSATILSYLGLVDMLVKDIRAGNILGLYEQILFMLILVFFVYGNLLYLLTRWGYLRRRSTHTKAKWTHLERLFDGKAPSLTILVPSYKEDVEVVRRTLMSAALQDYPNKRVVLLIDDPPNPASQKDREGLDAMRSLPGEIQRLLDEASRPLEMELEAYLERRRVGIDPSQERKALGRRYRSIALWFSHLAATYPPSDHGSKLLVDKVFQRCIRVHRARARQLSDGVEEPFPEAEILHHYRRLARLFRVHISSFERKRYVNLSREANKAMNLNSYIGLIGRSFREISRKDGIHLEPTAAATPDLTVPNAEFLIMLDADSLLVPDYAIRLIHHMIEPGNERVAIAQTPYSTIPDAPGVLERVAGATTDIQYIIHQGFTAHNGTYWVGANAIARKTALDDIAEKDLERGFPITRYIQDHTVIEDTESSVDLAHRGWTLYNYPDRLAYSATPPDFGSLLIQRRRWANGGLLIVPKLMRYLVHGPNLFSKAKEGFFRFHYLFSITAVNFGLLILLLYPFRDNVSNLWLPLTALPYFYLYGRDLVQIGYRWVDLLRVYALNLMLIPINLGGVLTSVCQGMTGRKVPFGRTPKVADRTAAPALYLVAEYGLFFVGLVGLVRDVRHGLWVHAFFCLINVIFLGYALVRFIGLRESAEDFALAWAGWKNGRSLKMVGAIGGSSRDRDVVESLPSSVFMVERRITRETVTSFPRDSI